MEDWLRQAGYEYYSFISWPHTASNNLTRCARRLKQDIESGLAESVSDPKVFLDETVLMPGDKWSEVIQQALCKSLTMVAVCAPISYHPKHYWCGLEWATMDQLSNVRLRGANYQAIFPVLIRKSESDPLPDVVSAIEYIDFTTISVRKHNYFLSSEFTSQTEWIVQRIMEVAETVATNLAATNCKEFTYPTVSAFEGYNSTRLPSPFH